MSKRVHEKIYSIAFAAAGRVLFFLLLVPVSCERDAGPQTPRHVVDDAVVSDSAPPVPSNNNRHNRPRVVFLGDSLTAGLGLAQAQAFPAIVARHLSDKGRPIELVNAGVSGDTSAGGLGRLDWLLRQKPDVLVLCLGANDGLRGLPPQVTKRNLGKIIQQAKAAKTRVLLLGLRLPPNYGLAYTDKFARVFPELAEELDVPLVPMLLEGVGGRPELNLPDGIHPNARGHEIMAQNVMPALEKALAELGR